MLRSIAIIGAGRGLTVVVSVFLAKWFGADAWGSASTARALTELPVLFSRGGAEQRVLKTCKGDKHGSPHIAYRIAGNMQALLLVSSAIVIPVYLLLPGQKVSVDLIVVFAIAMTLHAPLQLKTVWEAILGRHRAIITDNITVQALRGALSAILSLVFVGALAIALGYLIAVAASLVIVGCKWLRPPRFQPGSDLLENADLGVNYVLAGTMSRLDLIVVSVVLGSVSAGAYALLQGICSLVGIIGQAQGRLVGPLVGSGLQDGVLNAKLEQVKLAQKLTAVACLPLVLIIAPLAQAFSSAMGAGFEIDWRLALVVCASYCVAAIFSCEGFVLSLSNRQSAERVVLIGYALVVAIGAVLGAHSAGLAGVAWAVLFANVVLAVWRRRTVARAIGDDAAAILVWRFRQYVAAALVLLAGTGGYLALDALGLMQRVLAVVPVVLSAAVLGYFAIFTAVERQSAWQLLVGRRSRE